MIDTQHMDEIAATPGAAAAGHKTGDSALRSPTTDTLALEPYVLHRRFFIGAIAAQFLALGFLTLAPLSTLATGKVYTFETAPCEPWDMFRGEYVTLNFSFNRIPTKLPFTRGQKIYTVLAKGVDGKWQAVRFAAHKLTADEGEVVLAGTVDRNYGEAVDVKYGIEQVFVPEGKGKEAERAGSLKVDVAVGADGNAVIKQARKDDHVYYQWKLI